MMYAMMVDLARLMEYVRLEPTVGIVHQDVNKLTTARPSWISFYTSTYNQTEAGNSSSLAPVPYLRTRGFTKISLQRQCLFTEVMASSLQSLIIMNTCVSTWNIFLFSCFRSEWEIIGPHCKLSVTINVKQIYYNHKSTILKSKLTVTYDRKLKGSIICATWESWGNGVLKHQ